MRLFDGRNRFKKKDDFTKDFGSKLELNKKKKRRSNYRKSIIFIRYNINGYKPALRTVSERSVCVELT